VSARRCNFAAWGYFLKRNKTGQWNGFHKEKDVFVSLPTCYGKSLCYILIPPVLDLLRNVIKPINSFSSVTINGSNERSGLISFKIWTKIKKK